MLYILNFLIAFLFFPVTFFQSGPTILKFLSAVYESSSCTIIFEFHWASLLFMSFTKFRDVWRPLCPQIFFCPVSSSSSGIPVPCMWGTLIQSHSFLKLFISRFCAPTPFLRWDNYWSVFCFSDCFLCYHHSALKPIQRNLISVIFFICKIIFNSLFLCWERLSFHLFQFFFHEA